MSDGMGTLSFADEEDSIYFGPSSTVAFIGHVSSVILGGCQQNTASPSSPSSSSLYHAKLILSQTRPKESPVHRNPQQVNKFAIPPTPVVMSLFDQYFRNTYIIFPLLHPKSFVHEYEEAVRTGFTNVTRTWLARLNMVLAIATSASTDSDISKEKHEKAEQFYLRAAGLYDGRILKSASLESVQILILMSQYLQGTQKPIQCWHSLGLAIRTALQLGLHSKQALKRFSPLERELRKRTWHACVLVDRTICMTFGRPSCIPVHVSKKIQLPLDVDDEVLEMSTTETPEKSLSPSVITFYIQTIHLFDILANIIDEIYSDNLDWNDDMNEDLTTNSYELASRIAKIEKALFIWRSSLPRDLQIISAEEVHFTVDSNNTPDYNEVMNNMSFILRRQRIILTLRYHSVRILLHRQTISNCLISLSKRRKSAPRISLTFEMDSIQTALESAIETVNIVQRVGDHVSLLGAWWFTLYYVFKSALIMVSVLVIYNECELRLPAVVSAEDIRTHLKTAVSVIETMSRKNEIADRCLLFLRYLKHAVSTGPEQVANYRYPDPYIPEPTTSTQPHQPRNHLDLGMGMGEFMLESDLNMLEELFKHTNGAIGI